MRFRVQGFEFRVSAMLRRFEELEAWQKARTLTRLVYEHTRAGEFAKDFGLRVQIRRAAVSVMSNIAEGFERGGNTEFVHFLTMAKGSAGEVEAQLYVAMDQEYLEKEEFRRMRGEIDSIKRLIGGLMRHLKQSGLKGQKFK